MYDLIIIGGGPAGLAATVYALRRQLNVLLVTKDLGGKTNYRLSLENLEYQELVDGKELVRRFKNEIEYQDFVLRMMAVTHVEALDSRGFLVHTSEEERLASRAIIIATGVNPQWLGVPGEKDFKMRGLVYSSVSYAPLFADKKVVVVGQGQLALRSATELARSVSHISLVMPDRQALDTPLGRRLEETGKVTWLTGYTAKEVRGDLYVRSLVVRSAAGEEREICAEGIFVELALLPNSGIVADLVELDREGRIIVDARNRTSHPGIFAAGDVTDGFVEEIPIAVGEGAKAAISAYEYLLGI
jgi:thioredoxin reductase